MASLNRTRFLLSGLAAGLVLNISGMVSAGLLGLAESFATFEVVPGGAGVLLHLALRFGIGLAGAYIYVSMTSRFGVGIRTALRVGVLIWLIGYAPSLALLREVGFLSGQQAVLIAAWGIVEACAAMSLAALLYRPAGTGSAA